MPKGKKQVAMVPLDEVEKVLKSRIDAMAAEMDRLRKIEEEHKNLLSLVKVVAKTNHLAIDQHVEIRISKQEQMKSDSWEQLLEKHFEKYKKTIITI